MYGATSSSAVTVSALNGVAMCYVFDYAILVTGVEATTLRRTLWGITYGDGFDSPVGVWTSLLVQQQAESDSSVAYSAPSLAYLDTYRITWLEADTFVGGNTRVYRSSLNPQNGWIAGANLVRAPVPGELRRQRRASPCAATPTTPTSARPTTSARPRPRSCSSTSAPT